MESLVDRYLQAVRFWLPKGQQDDISAELAEDLRSKMEEQQEGLGRELNDEEIATVLKQTGRPFLVAGRYLPQQSLIGPVLFPVYVFVLKVVALCYLLPWVVVFVGMLIFNASYRQGHSIMGHLADVWGTLWLTALTGFAAITIVFAIIERSQKQVKLLEDWDPRKLPAIRNTNQIKRSSSIAEIIANAVLALWWANGWASLVIFTAAGVRIVVTPVWSYLVWTLLAICVANIALAVANIVRPWWTQTRAWLRLALDAVGAGVFCVFLRSEVLAALAAPGLSSSQAATAVHAINMAMHSVFPLCVLLCVLIVAAADVPRLFRLLHGRSSGGSPVVGTTFAR